MPAGDYTPNEWANAVLRRLKIKATRANTRALVGWSKAEGGHWNNTAKYNPLNTTQNMPGSGDTGTQGNISVYRDWNQGVDATVKTLNNGMYGGILNALKGNDPVAVGRAVQASPWGTKSDLILKTIASAPGHPLSGAGRTALSAASSPTIGSTPTASPQQPSTASRLLDIVSRANAQPEAQGLPISQGFNAPDNNTLSMAQAASARLQQQQQTSMEMIQALKGAPEDTSEDTWSASQDPSPLVGASRGGSNGEGAEASISWAESKLGFKETGTNAGGIASYLNKQFGMSNQPWCAMFTSAAATKGGAPMSARTASVAQVRALADAGDGYKKGVFSGKQARRGDFIMWGNNHIAMVTGNKDGKISYIGGNQSDGVTTGSTSAGSVDAVRPLYGARRRG